MCTISGGGRHIGNRIAGRPSCRWEDNTKMCLKGIAWGVVDWIYLALKGQISEFCEHSNEIQV